MRWMSDLRWSESWRLASSVEGSSPESSTTVSLVEEEDFEASFEFSFSAVSSFFFFWGSSLSSASSADVALSMAAFQSKSLR